MTATYLSGIGIFSVGAAELAALWQDPIPVGEVGVPDSIPLGIGRPASNKFADVKTRTTIRQNVTLSASDVNLICTVGIFCCTMRDLQQKRHKGVRMLHSHVNEENTSVAVCRGMAAGILFLTLFGGLWAVAGVKGLDGIGNPWIFVATIAIFAALAVLGAVIVVNAYSVESDSKPNFSDARRRRVRFRIVLFVEVGLIAIAVMILRGVGRTDLIAPVVMLVVSLHFIPLAVLFRLPIYYTVAAALFLVDLVAVVAVPEQIHIYKTRVSPQLVVIGLGGAVCLWAAAFFNALATRSTLKTLKQHRRV